MEKHWLQLNKSKKMNKKGFLQISFAWLFAIIVGAMILSLTIYAVTKTISTQETIIGAKTANEIGVLLNPLETGFEVGKTTTIIFPAETRIYNRCNNLSVFGKQGIQISQKSFDKWTQTDVEVSFENKYIFSEAYAEGKTFYIFSKPLEFPFKVTDLIYLTSSNKNYCFLNAPENIKEELETLSQGNIFTKDCEDLSNKINVCFNYEDCDVQVNYGAQTVEKEGEILHFRTDALMYATIFSDKKIYNCQLQRIMKRIKQLSKIYQDKESFISQRGCNSNLGNDLVQLSNSANGLIDSANIGSVWNIAQKINDNELNSQCRLW
ncbi:MAG: hypothetical protein ABFQ65_00460 [Nanoarchaeota archaeon]